MTKPTYPAARRLDLHELLPAAAPTFDVPDPYRWLEDPATPESVKWLEAEDALANEHLSALAGPRRAARPAHVADGGRGRYRTCLAR